MIAFRAFIVASLVVSFAGCQQKPMTEFVSPDGKFKAKLPGEPKVSVDSAVGIVLKMYQVETWRKSYMIGWADLPIPTWESETKSKSRLFDARDGALKAVNGKSNGTTKVILLADKYPGIEFGGTAENRHIRARVYLVGTRMYQMLIAAKDESYPTSPEADEFFASFELLSPPAATPTGSPAAPENAAAAAHPPGSLIESSTGKFQARYPVRPTKFSRSIGGVDFTGWTADGAGGTCAVGYSDLTGSIDGTPATVFERLDAARDATVADRGGTLGTTKRVTLAGKSGREFTASAGDKHLRGRLFLVGNRLYQVTVQGPESYTTSKEADAFLASFQITK